jgi:hypothetical protein
MIRNMNKIGIIYWISFEPIVFDTHLENSSRATMLQQAENTSTTQDIMHMGEFIS